MTDFPPFVARHVGPDADDQAKMLAAVGYGSLVELLSAAVPGSVHETGPLRLPPAPPRRTSPPSCARWPRPTRCSRR